MTAFPPKWWLSSHSIGAPTFTPSSHTLVDGPRRGGLVGISNNLIWVSKSHCNIDGSDLRWIDLFILFYHRTGIIFAPSGGGNNLHATLKPLPRPSWTYHGRIWIRTTRNKIDIWFNTTNTTTQSKMQYVARGGCPRLSIALSAPGTLWNNNRVPHVPGRSQPWFCHVFAKMWGDGIPNLLNTSADESYCNCAQQSMKRHN